MSLAAYLQTKIHQSGPISFSEYMDTVLYHPRFGYYSSLRTPIGPEGDYYTSPDLDPIFGRLLAKRFEQMAEPFDSFTLVELGAGKGLLARSILEYRKFPYLILERSAAMREHQRRILDGFEVSWIDELPRGITGCVFSNEFFDALPVHRLVRRDGVLRELYVNDKFEEVEGDPQHVMNLPVREGQTADIGLEARVWIRRIAASLERGYHMAIDYGYLSDEFYAQPHGTLMCYWRHQAVENPYVRIGEQDITAHVNFSDLMEEGRQVGLETQRFQTQMDFLIELGILDEIQKLAYDGNAASVQRLLRIKKLILPGSMGERFKVLLQRKNC
jgi:SAM-dependent MidA family methyltransferase